MTLEDFVELSGDFGTVWGTRLWKEKTHLVGLVEFSTRSEVMKALDELDRRKM